MRAMENNVVLGVTAARWGGELESIGADGGKNNVIFWAAGAENIG